MFSSGKEEFKKHLEFSYQKALFSFIKDNALLFCLILGVSTLATITGGAKSILTNRHILNGLLVLIICRAFYNGLEKPSIRIQNDSAEDTE